MKLIHILIITVLVLCPGISMADTSPAAEQQQVVSFQETSAAAFSNSSSQSNILIRSLVEPHTSPSPSSPPLKGGEINSPFPLPEIITPPLPPLILRGGEAEPGGVIFKEGVPKAGVLSSLEGEGVLPMNSSVNIQNEEAVIILAQSTRNDEEEITESALSENNDVFEEYEEEAARIADPIAPFNKVMFHFNDKLYFWLLKPVASVYSYIIPEDFRFIFGNAYDNLKAPGRMLNNLFQPRPKATGNELIRFVFNSVIGVGGLGDPAKHVLNIKKQDADLGQTLGHYGIGHGFYLVLPLFGPSSLRDGIGLAGDRFMYPLTYVSSSDLTFSQTAGIYTLEKVNDTSFKIGDYESFKESAIDPYVSMRDAFLQHRKKDVEESKK